MWHPSAVHELSGAEPLPAELSWDIVNKRLLLRKVYAGNGQDVVFDASASELKKVYFSANTIIIYTQKGRYSLDYHSTDGMLVPSSHGLFTLINMIIHTKNLNDSAAVKALAEFLKSNRVKIGSSNFKALLIIAILLPIIIVTVLVLVLNALA